MIKWAAKGVSFIFMTILLGGCGVIYWCDGVRGSGNIVTEKREVCDFSKIELRGCGDVIIMQGDREGVEVEADDNLMSYIVTDVNGGTLRLDLKGSVWSSHSIKYHVRLKTLEEATVIGSGNISAEKLSVENLTLRASGSGDITIHNLTAATVESDISGSGNLKLSGETGRQIVKINGSGDYFAADLKSTAASVHIRGSGDVSVRASESIDAEVSGSGDLRYFGNPALKSCVIKGSGNVKKCGE